MLQKSCGCAMGRIICSNILRCCSATGPALLPLQTAGAMLYRYRRRLLLRCFGALKINVQQSRLVIELPKLQTEGAQPSDGKSAAGPLGLSSKGLKITSSTDKLDAELDELMRINIRDRKYSESLRRSSRQGSLSGSNRRVSGAARSNAFGAFKSASLLNIRNVRMRS